MGASCDLFLGWNGRRMRGEIEERGREEKEEQKEGEKKEAEVWRGKGQ
jgi:hypothetical protein